MKNVYRFSDSAREFSEVYGTKAYKIMKLLKEIGDANALSYDDKRFITGDGSLLVLGWNFNFKPYLKCYEVSFNVGEEFNSRNELVYAPSMIFAEKYIIENYTYSDDDYVSIFDIQELKESHISYDETDEYTEQMSQHNALKALDSVFERYKTSTGHELPSEVEALWRQIILEEEVVTQTILNIPASIWECALFGWIGRTVDQTDEGWEIACNAYGWKHTDKYIVKQSLIIFDFKEER